MDTSPCILSFQDTFQLEGLPKWKKIIKKKDSSNDIQRSYWTDLSKMWIAKDLVWRIWGDKTGYRGLSALAVRWSECLSNTFFLHRHALLAKGKKNPVVMSNTTLSEQEDTVHHSGPQKWGGYHACDSLVSFSDTPIQMFVFVLFFYSASCLHAALL